MWVINIFLVIILAFNPTLGQELIAQGWQLYTWIPIPNPTDIHTVITHIIRGIR